MPSIPDPETIVVAIKTGTKVLKAARKVGKKAKKAYNNAKHDGKDNIGSVRVRDMHGCLWKVRVRNSGKRGRYLKLKPKGHAADKFRASCDGYKPDEYRAISENDWLGFMYFAEGYNDWEGRVDEPELFVFVKYVLNKMIYSKNEADKAFITSGSQGLLQA